jgi:putative peptidoglycan lipid II flippase
VIVLIMPAVLGLTVFQAYGLIEMILASEMSRGTIAVLSYANKLVQFPLGLFVVALGIASFPTISSMAAVGEREEYAATVNRLVRVTLLGMLPASVILMVLNKQIISLFYLSGDFGQNEVEMTALALFFYSVGLTGQAANIILTKAFYAIQDTRTPVKITFATVLVSLAMSLILIRYMGFTGLPLANAIASLVGTALFIILFQKKTSALSLFGLARFIVPVIGATVLLAGVCAYTGDLLSNLLNIAGRPGYLIQIVGSMTAGMAVFIAAALVFKVEELQIAIRYMRAAMLRRER